MHHERCQEAIEQYRDALSISHKPIWGAWPSNPRENRVQARLELIAE
jgi:hypothetical protein